MPSMAMPARDSAETGHNYLAQRVEDIQAKKDELEISVSYFQNTNTKLEERIDRLEKRIDKIEERIDRLESDKADLAYVHGIDDHIDRLESDNADLTDINRLDERIDRLESDNADLAAGLKDPDEHIDKIEIDAHDP